MVLYFPTYAQHVIKCFWKLQALGVYERTAQKGLKNARTEDGQYDTPVSAANNELWGELPGFIFFNASSIGRNSGTLFDLRVLMPEV